MSGTARPGDPIIKFLNVSKTFAKGNIKAVDNVSLDIARGEIFGFIGYSGAGKSTLVRLINALEKADSGVIQVLGQDVTKLNENGLNQLRSQIGMIFQQFNLFTARTVLANVAYPLKLVKASKAEREKRARELLEFVGIADKADSYPAQLSGGQKQRVGIARALASNPQILLADEATSALDPETTRDVLDLLRKVNTELGITLVVITHAMEVVQYICDRVAVMENGKIVESGATYDVFAKPAQTVTQRFINTALHDRPSPETVARLRKYHPGRLVLVRLRDDGASSFALTAATKGTGVFASIVFGSIVEVEGRPLGSVTLELVGDIAATDEVISRLGAAGSQVTDLGTAGHPISDEVWQLLVHTEGSSR
ncbi:MAG: ATP-binding cassette domain-containing protein [Propionibacteriaceae bacterium]|jgi:D-methionine transport system ATP-binding protein|nr:ATP-binding cassette domain-containing protein [Propionibacteriaceae bacterium]